MEDGDCHPRVPFRWQVSGTGSHLIVGLDSARSETVWERGNPGQGGGRNQQDWHKSDHQSVRPRLLRCLARGRRDSMGVDPAREGLHED